MSNQRLVRNYHSKLPKDILQTIAGSAGVQSICCEETFQQKKYGSYCLQIKIYFVLELIIQKKYREFEYKTVISGWIFQDLSIDYATNGPNVFLKGKQKWHNENWKLFQEVSWYMH